MAMSYEDAVAIGRRHENRILGLPGVSGVGVKLRNGMPVLEVSVDPDGDVPTGLEVPEIEGLPLVVERRRFRPQSS